MLTIDTIIIKKSIKHYYKQTAVTIGIANKHKPNMQICNVKGDKYVIYLM